MAQESLKQKQKQKDIHQEKEPKTPGKKTSTIYKVRLEKDEVREYAKQLIKNNKKVFDRLAKL